MKRIKKLLAAALLLWLLTAAFQQAALASFLCPTVSLRYEESISPEQVEDAKGYALKNEGPWFTFWTERTVFVEGCAAQQITFDGDGAVAYPAEYLHGRAPSNWEPETCAVSTGLAWALWGGENVVGLDLTVEDVTCRVVGVFPVEVPLLIRPDTRGFTAVELENVPPGEDSYRFAANYAYVCGLGMPDEIFWGPGFAAWIQILPWIPMILAMVPLIGQGVRGYRKLSGFWQNALGFGMAFAVALALPVLLDRLPPWLLPTRWSDFDFWARLGETLADRCRDFFALDPRSRDIQVKIAMAKAVSATLGACVIMKLDQK